MISSRSLGLVLVLLLAACSRKDSSNGASAEMDAGEVLPLDAGAFRNLAEHPYRYHELKKDKTEGADARTTRTYPAVGLGKQQVDVTIVERQHTAWSLRFAATKAQPAQFGKVDTLFAAAASDGTATWYRIDNDALEGCYLLAQQTGGVTNIVIESADYVALDQGAFEKALAEWLVAHPQDAGH